MEKTTLADNRLISLDVFRGITMFLLIAEAALVYQAFTNYFEPGSFGAAVFKQFHHHPWNGLRFWDLIQPYFMFIVGVAMPFSMKKRLSGGATWGQSFKHILFRCGLLFLLGTGLHCIYSGKLVWELWNVLTQLSFTVLVTFVLMRWSIKWQLLGSILFLILTEILYRTYDPAQPFVMDQNFGSWMDMLLMGKLNDGGGWVTINCLPTAAHTIWGAVCGQVLLSEIDPKEKLSNFAVAGLGALFIGYSLDLLDITPIVKRIATTSFVFASGGWCLLTLTFLYWLVDLKKVRRWTKFFIIVGMNPLFIYLFAETVGHQWLVDKVSVFNNGFLGMLGIPDQVLAITSAFFTLAVFWYLCYFLYRKKIIIKI